MSETVPASPAGTESPVGAPVPVIAVTGSDIGWLELKIRGLLPSATDLPSSHDIDTAEATWRLPDGRPDPLPWGLAVDPETERAAVSAGRVRLTDAEGAFVAEVRVSAAGSPGPHGWLSGALERAVPPSHLDFSDLRLPDTGAEPPADTPVAVVWVPPNLSATWRVRVAAAFAGYRLVTVATLDPARATSLPAQLPPRSLRVLAANPLSGREDDGHLLLPLPELGWTAREIGVRALIGRSLGADLVVVPGGLLDDLPSPERARLDKLAADNGVALAQLGAEVDGPADSERDPVEQQLREQERLTQVPRGHQGFTVLLTGFSGSGKSTIARALTASLLGVGSRPVSLLDGDVVRLNLSRGLGFSAADRDINVARIGYVAAEVTKAGGVAICCPIAPNDAVRQQVRAMVQEHGTFALVHVSTTLAECERRDRKGLYAKARRGEIPDFTGISAPYDVPRDADLSIDTAQVSLDDAVEQILTTLRARGLEL